MKKLAIRGTTVIGSREGTAAADPVVTDCSMICDKTRRLWSSSNRHSPDTVEVYEILFSPDKAVELFLPPQQNILTKRHN